jgi:hypothetical protein
MKYIFIVVILLVFGLFIAGCTGSTNSSDQGKTTPGGAQSTNTSSSGGGSSSGAGASGSGGATGFENKDFATLAAMGVPLQCDITMTYQGNTTTVRIYMKGDKEVRTEVSTSSSQCSKSVSIIKDDKWYMGCENSNIMGTCKWLKFNMTSSSDDDSTGGDYSASYSAPDFSEVPSTKINCQPWVYDASKFTPSGGTVCSFEDLMKGMYQQD